MSVLRYAAACGILAALMAPAVPARASATTDLQSFVRKTAPLTFPDYIALRGAATQKGEWKSAAVYGPSLTRCLVVDLPSMDSLFGGTPGQYPYSSALQCDGAKTKMTQAALVAWAIKTIAPLAPGRTMKRYPPSKRTARWSVTWKNATGQTIDFIAYGTKDDLKNHPRVGYVIDIEQLSPATMATPAPSSSP
jgi:hypothetical protein